MDDPHYTSSTHPNGVRMRAETVSKLLSPSLLKNMLF